VFTLADVTQEKVPVIVPISHPSEGSAGRTGLWRVFKPIINTNKCKKCFICWLVCPEESIEEGKDGYPEIDYTYCKGCGVCSDNCPTGAISLVKEEG